LSGRAPRGGAGGARGPSGTSTASAPASTSTPSAAPSQPFSGQGNTLGGKKKPEVIEID
jgi:hypothetical protein